MALVHEFQMFKTVEEVVFDKESRKDMVRIDDYLILYMVDSMSWIPSYTRDFKSEDMGLNYYGRTYLNKTGIVTLKNILHGWIQLFNEAPSEIALTTGFNIEENDFDKEIVKKTEIMDELNLLEELCIKAINEDCFIVHFGI